MGLFKKTEKQSDDETPDDIDKKCPHRERTVPHSGTPFTYEITTAGADKSATSCKKHCFNHIYDFLVKDYFLISIVITQCATL